jgi:hypothetical protein
MGLKLTKIHANSINIISKGTFKHQYREDIIGTTESCLNRYTLTKTKVHTPVLEFRASSRTYTSRNSLKISRDTQRSGIS